VVCHKPGLAVWALVLSFAGESLDNVKVRHAAQEDVEVEEPVVVSSWTIKIT
jgi:hypothetical protein